MLSKQQFVFIKYGNVDYPSEYSTSIYEIAGHFDKDEIENYKEYSLHTEYSYGKRKLNSELISNFQYLQTSTKDSVPQLWKSSQWASEFAEFITVLAAGKNPPYIIEIHPPFNDYCNLYEFIDRFIIFEESIHKVYPNVSIVIENRAGSIYHGGKFLIGKASEIYALCDAIKRYNINLSIVLDFPQLLTAENIDPSKFNISKYQTAIDTISQFKDTIAEIHIWGKKKSATGRWVAHCGNLSTLFMNNEESKQLFIEGIHKICNDNKIRYLVPEVNSGTDDLHAIMNDLFK